MSKQPAFAWFHNKSDDPRKTIGFYETLLSWQGSPTDDGSHLLVATDGPFAGIASRGPAPAGWVPFVAVPDLDAATKNAAALGGVALGPRQAGPMGDFSILKDPGGAVFALWQARK